MTIVGFKIACTRARTVRREDTGSAIIYRIQRSSSIGLRGLVIISLSPLDCKWGIEQRSASTVNWEQHLVYLLPTVKQSSYSVQYNTIQGSKKRLGPMALMPSLILSETNHQSNAVYSGQRAS